MDLMGTGLATRVTDDGLRALASAGVGAQLTCLTIFGEWACACCVFGSELCIFFLCYQACGSAAVHGVSDDGLCALASAGCGEQLTFLTLSCGCQLLLFPEEFVCSGLWVYVTSTRQMTCRCFCCCRFGKLSD